MVGCGDGSLAGTLTLILPLVLMVVVFYFLLIRPQKKKEKQVKAMLDALKPGDRVTTIGGIYGTVTSIKDDMITLAVGITKTEMVFARWAIRNVDEQGVDNDTEVLA
ncbi:MAG: preprotein translocase subunit YajC [Clostridiales bacterium]|nr:preprotein translocase subunit YajC [Clostridiales bacterium]